MAKEKVSLTLGKAEMTLVGDGGEVVGVARVVDFSYEGDNVGDAIEALADGLRGSLREDQKRRPPRALPARSRR